MKREQRISTFRRTLESGEREASGRVQDANSKVAEARDRLEQLRRYKGDYTASFGVRASQGISGPALLDFRAFIARLEEAIQQQAQLVARLEGDRQQAQGRLREVAVRNRAVGAVVERWRAEERVDENRREQRNSDERSQQSLRIATVSS